MVVDAAKVVDEGGDALFVKSVQRIYFAPGGERDSVFHGRVWGEDDVPGVAEHQISEFFHEFGTIAAVILNEYAAVFEVMHLEALVDGPLVHAPADDGRIMGPRGGRVRIIGDGGARADADVAVAEGGRVARLVRGCARKVIDAEDDRDDDARPDERGRAVVL